MSAYAKRTKVPASKSRAEIEQLLTRYGATSFASGWDATSAVIMCEANGRRLRFVLPMPDSNDDAETRRRWRALALVIKAKLEGVASGIETFEAAFLANIVVPGGNTFAEWARPQIARAYETGAAMPPLLGAGGVS